MNHLIKALGVASVATMMLTGAGFQSGGTTISGENTGLVGTKTIALTFDDGPGDKTGDLLDMLKANDIHNWYGTFLRDLDDVGLSPAEVRFKVRPTHVTAPESWWQRTVGRFFSSRAS